MISSRKALEITFSTACVRKSILVLYAGIHRVQFGYNRLLARRFPYAVYYRILEGEAVVFRVLDCRRAPRWIRKSLKETG